jgi:S1-C subfamily serine protease
MSPARRRLNAALAAAVASAVLLAGCGGGGDEGSEFKSAPSENEARQQANADSSNGSFNPQAIYNDVADGVVTVISVLPEAQELGPGGAVGQGSGFVLNDKGEIATNAHVVASGEGKSIKPAKDVFIEFSDRSRVKADVVGVDPNSDVALLKVDPDGLELVPVPLSDGKGIVVGQPVAAIGSPFGERQSLSVGVISATDRAIESLTDFRIDNAIQTDAAINKGNSGGPLLNADGRVIGINQQIKSETGGGEGVGFAVPVTAVRRSLEELRDDGEVDYAFIGVSSQALYPQLAEKLGIDAKHGALVGEVVNGGPADRAGIKGGSKTVRFQGSEVKAGGDVIIAVGGQRVVTENDLAEIVSKYRPGDKIEIVVLRDGQRKTIEVTAGKRPANVPRTG